MALRKIQSELNELMREPPTAFIIRGVSDDFFHWEVTFTGPLRTPFAGGVFRIFIDFPSNYPFEPPEVHFKTKVFHPNISREGFIFPNIVRSYWTSSHTISMIIPSIRAFLMEPNLYHPLVPEIARMYENDRALYELLAGAWTRLYAREEDNA
ncbi:ubiquitin-conjugating enzyme E2-17 kDa-like [Phalaenopsis equestris]|uniref:ubiquitin-conjugating enzyme E2-17 kDa-like n=1 Tax=Phalaenopsis equestris TaxID=78828 RepID=UPI0009E4BBFA|nr:ubiquitin-conjugating enzyme E2-17 kDa-like [Phalaenopsis equestris]